MPLRISYRVQPISNCYAWIEKLRTSDWWWGWAEWRAHATWANLAFRSFGTEPGSSFWSAELSSKRKYGYLNSNLSQRLTRGLLGAEMPFLLVQLNDWVAKVRDTSSRAAPLFSDRMQANQFEAAV